MARSTDKPDRKPASGAPREPFPDLVEFDAAPVPLALSSRGAPLRVNAAFTRAFGWTTEQVVQMTALELTVLEDRPALEKALSRLDASGEVSDLVVRVWTGDRRQVLCRLSATVLRHDPGDVRILWRPVPLGRITEPADRTGAQGRPEAPLPLLEEFDTAPIPLVLSRPGLPRRVNAAYTRVFGWTSKAIGNREWSDLVAAEDLPVLERARETLMAGGEVHDVEVRGRTPDGRFIRCRFSAMAGLDASGQTYSLARMVPLE